MAKEVVATIQEEFELPSKGLIYTKKFDPHVKLRSMTTADEMKRLQYSETPYKTMSEIIEGCLLTKLPISVYDLCLGDYQFLLHKLRVVTYGDDYSLGIKCPECGEVFEWDCNLSKLKINYIKEKEYNDDSIIILPDSKKKIKLRLQTPRDLDYIATKSAELKKEFPTMTDPTLLLTLETMIDTVDDGAMIPDMLGNMINSMPMRDANYLIQKATKFNGKVGVDTVIKATCPKCGHDVNTLFRFTSEFFGPKVD